MYRQSENSNTFPTCPYNMVNFGPLATEIGSLVWGTPTNFDGFRVLATLLHGTLEVGVSQTLRRWTAGRPSLWALAHILVYPCGFYLSSSFLWPPCVADADIIFSSCGFLSFFFFSSPNVSRCRLDVYHICTHGVALVQNAGLKCAARGSLKVEDAKNRQKFAIWVPSYNFVGLCLCN